MNEGGFFFTTLYLGKEGLGIHISEYPVNDRERVNRPAMGYTTYTIPVMSDGGNLIPET